MSSKRSYRHEFTWWSVEVPEDWFCTQNENCVTMYANPALGVLQISSAKKETGSVTDEELREFANDRITTAKARHDLLLVKNPNTSGIHISYETKGILWKEWWLRHGSIMLYVTYNISAEMSAVIRTFEFDKIKEIVDSIRVTG